MIFLLKIYSYMLKYKSNEDGVSQYVQNNSKSAMSLNPVLPSLSYKLEVFMTIIPVPSLDKMKLPKQNKNCLKASFKSFPFTFLFLLIT